MTLEEVSIRLGVDSSQMASGLMSGAQIAERSMKSTMQALKSLIKVNMVSAISDLISLWDSYTKKLAEAVYHVNELGEKKRQYWREEYKAFLEQQKTLQDQEKQRQKNYAEEKKNFEQVASLESKLAIERESNLEKRFVLQKKLADEELKSLREAINVRGSMVENSKIAVAIAEKEIEINRLVTDEKKRQAEIENQLASARAAATKAEAGLASALRSQSDVSLSEAQRLADLRLGAQKLPELQIGEQAARDVQRAQRLAIEAQQARLNGDPDRADALTRQRLGLLSKLGFLGDAERDPLSVAREQLAAAQKQVSLLEGGLTIKTVK